MILLPLHHPVRVAEEVITLDIVSKGRVILGVGIGYQPADFRAFAVPMEHRVALFEEGVEVIRQCWTGDPFSFKGTHYALEDVQIGAVADRDRVGYRLRITNSDGVFLVEQQAYFGVENDRINWLRILCSGYRAIDDEPSQA